MGQRYDVLDGVHIDATWQMCLNNLYLNNLYSAVMLAIGTIIVAIYDYLSIGFLSIGFFMGQATSIAFLK